jgi:hypothetical protein
MLIESGLSIALPVRDFKSRRGGEAELKPENVPSPANLFGLTSPAEFVLSMAS